jgi:pyruvate,water dikinase
VNGVRVPDGFCVSTAAFGESVGRAPGLDAALDRLSRLDAEDRDGVRALSAEIRETIARTRLPEDVADAITRALVALGEAEAYAVRSSATAEDLPNASFAGQQDTYLNVRGSEAILAHVVRCWASLYSERAVTYRVQQGFDHRKVRMAVVVQRLIVPQAAGVLFTADPVTSNRRVALVEACFGLGEALVSGHADADRYKVRDGQLVAKTIATKKLATRASHGGGTTERAIDPAQQNQRALTDAQVATLERLGRRIEQHFGAPQDIEWCLFEDNFYIVQSRPITTCIPVPTRASEADASSCRSAINR